jgi:hypothetical protein
VKSFRETLTEEPTNSVGSGAIAGLGVGPDGEPGLTRAQQRAHVSRNKAKAKLRKKMRDYHDRREDVRATNPDEQGS